MLAAAAGSSCIARGLLAGARAAWLKAPQCQTHVPAGSAPGLPGPPPTLASSLPVTNSTRNAAESAAGPTQASTRRPRVFVRPPGLASSGDPRAIMAMEARADRRNCSGGQRTPPWPVLPPPAPGAVTTWRDASLDRWSRPAAALFPLPARPGLHAGQQSFTLILLILL